LKKFIKVLEWVGTFMLAIVVLLVGFMFIGPIFGWETHPVLSGSMEPALKVGGVIVTKPVKLEEVKMGDIITFQTGEQTISHRVVNIVEIDEKPWFQTKGDVNEEPDSNLVSSEGKEMRKVVFHLLYIGFIAQFLKNKWVFSALIGIPALILIGMFGRDFWKAILEKKEKRKVKTTNNHQF